MAGIRPDSIYGIGAEIPHAPSTLADIKLAEEALALTGIELKPVMSITRNARQAVRSAACLRIPIQLHSKQSPGMRARLFCVVAPDGSLDKVFAARGRRPIML
jgi:hypothetical protein